MTIESFNLPDKYRPTVLDDYIGQESVVSMVKGWIKTGRFPATILISGLSGAGKTTMARLISRYVNCEKHTSCGKCAACKFADGDNLVDTIEVNAGTSGGKDDIRNLIERAKRTPRFTKTIVLVDESHLLTDGAESALLVPIERPSKNAIWIFCTTNPEKMKDTVFGRCAKLVLKPVPPQKIYERLLAITKLEKPKVKDKELFKNCLMRIAKISEGQVRNAISLLDALFGLISSGEKFNEDSFGDLVSQSTEVDLNKAAADAVFSVLTNDLHGIIGACKSCKEPRKMIMNMRYLIDWSIDHSIGRVKYTPAIGKIFLDLMSKSKQKISLPALLKVQSVLLDVDHKLLTVPAFPAAIALYTQLADLSVDDYFKKVRG